MINATRDGEEDDPYRDLRVDFIPAGQSDYYSKLALLGAIGRGYGNPNTWYINLNRARDYLLLDGFYDILHPKPEYQTINMYLRLFAEDATQ